MTDPSQSALPPLPSPDFRLWWNSAAAAYKVNKPNIDEADVYTADQMRAYALAALAAQPQAEPSSATVPSDEQLYNSDEIMALNADMGLSLTQISKLARAVLALAAPAEVVAVDAPHSANFADLGIPDAPESWDEDQRDTWRRLQVAEHNKMQWRAYALKLRALAAPAVQEPMRASDPNCPNCPGSGVDGDAGDDGRTIEVACSCLSRPAAQSADAVDAKPPKGFDDAPVSYDCDAAWAWASGYESGWNERAAIAQSAAAAKATAEDEAIYKSIADNYFKAEPAEAGCAACGTGDSASSIIDTPQPWTQEHLKAYPKAALDILNKRGRQD